MNTTVVIYLWNSESFRPPSNTRPLGPAGCPDITMVTSPAFPSSPFLVAEAARGGRGLGRGGGWGVSLGWTGVQHIQSSIHRKTGAVRSLWQSGTCLVGETRTKPGERTQESEINGLNEGSVQLMWWQRRVLGVGGGWLTGC